MYVVGIDAGLSRSGVVAIYGGRVDWYHEVHVGPIKVPGPVRGQELVARYEVLQKEIESLKQWSQPDLVAIEQPGEEIRKDRTAVAVMHLHGAFAVWATIVKRIWPDSTVVGVTPRGWKGRQSKDWTDRVFAAKYGVRLETEHLRDALGIADYASDLLVRLNRARKSGANSR